MEPLGTLVLPPDVAIAPVTDLAPELQARIEGRGGEFTVTRPRTRTVSSIVDHQTAALLGHFRTPCTIIDAILSFCAAEGADPRATLDTAFGALVNLVGEGMLVPAGSAAARRVTESLTAGTVVAGVTVIESVHVLDDTEVYLGRLESGAHVALKLAGVTAGRVVHAAMENEIAVLARLHGVGAPALLDAGRWEERPFLVTSWADGVDLYRAAEEARAVARHDGPGELLGLASRVLDAYAALHSRGVVHGDVHPRNAVVDDAGSVVLLDFGLARASGIASPPIRGGIDLYQAPELACGGPAERGGTSPALSEQYSLGSLLFYLITGGHTHSFSLLPGEMLRQLAEEPQLPFAQYGTRDMPFVEDCLSRALSKQPERRYGSVRQFHAAFLDAARRDLSARPLPGGAQRRSTALDGVLDAVLRRLDPEGGLYAVGLESPTASVTYGAAGIAYALLRIARARGDETLLAHADLWSNRAEAALGSDGAFWNPRTGIVPGVFGGSSLYHHAAGVHCVSALIAHAREDSHARAKAVSGFVTSSEGAADVDLAFGECGLLTGCALLLETLGPDISAEGVRTLGLRLVDRIGPALDPATLDGPGQPATLGAAHGLAGMAFAVLQWCEAAQTDPPPGLRELLDRLAGLGQPAGRGLRWPRRVGDAVSDSALAASWCNGAAGFVHLWTSAHRWWGDELYGRLAERAAWGAYEGALDAPGDLCCGFAGRGYALLAQHRHTADPRWLGRARVLVEHAAASAAAQSPYPDSLFHGNVGVALISAELASPEIATMPLVEAEGWPKDR